jgi:hypothetical protein
MKSVLKQASLSGSSLPCRHLVRLTFVVLLLGCSAAKAQSVYPIIPEPPDYVHSYNLSALERTGVIALRGIAPTLNGSNSNVAQVEADSVSPQARFTFEVNPVALPFLNRPVTTSPENWHWIGATGQVSAMFPNSLGNESLHANQVGEALYSNVNRDNTTSQPPVDPKGVAYNARIVNNYEAGRYFDNYVSTGFPLFSQEPVVNQSFVYNDGENQGRDAIFDVFPTTGLNGHILVSAVGSAETNNGHPSSPATARNSVAVGAYLGSSAAGPTIDGRSKPDITAPADHTSFSAGLVSGAAALLVEAGNALPPPIEYGAADFRTVKALLLNGAVKPLIEQFPENSWKRAFSDLGFREPLDRRQGAGIVNVFNSYKQLQAGRLEPFEPPTTRLSGWDFRAVARYAPPKQYFIHLPGDPENQRYTGTVTIAWSPSVTFAGEGGYLQSDFNLLLFSGQDLVASSVSTVDTVEHLFVEALPAGPYELRVLRTNNDADPETFGFAYNFVPQRLIQAVSRKTHGGAGIFDVPLPLSGSPGVECRSAVNGQHQVVLTFAAAVTFNTAAAFWTDAVSSGTGTIESTSGSGTNTVTVNFSGVANAHVATVALYGVNDGSNMTDEGVRIGLLLGDTNGNGAVNASDVLQTKAQSGQPASGANFRTDVTVNGSINAADISTVSGQSGTTLP